MRPPRATAAFLLPLLLVLAGCGVELGGQLSGYQKPDRPMTTADECGAMSHFVDPADPWWLEVHCPAVAEPEVITQNELLPAMFGVHALPPFGTYWDWSGFEQGCRHIAASLPAITEAADTAPEGAEEIVDLMRDYVQVLDSWSSKCIPAAVDRDFAEVQAINQDLLDAGRIASELKRETMRTLRDN